MRGELSQLVDLERLRMTRLGEPKLSLLDDGLRENSACQGGAVVGRAETSLSEEENLDGAREARLVPGMSASNCGYRPRARCLAICALFISSQDSFREQLVEQ